MHRKVGYSRQVCGQVNKNIKGQFFILVFVLISGLILWPHIAEAYERDKYRWFAYFMGVIFVLGLVMTVRELIKLSAVWTNLSKNELEIHYGKIMGVYTDTPKIPNSEKYINIEFSQIDRVDVVTPNMKMDQYHNLLIYCKFGLVKFCVEDPYGICKEIETHRKAK